MGIAIQELLALEFFKDFHVIAGIKGLKKEIQGVTVLEAPDAFHWTRGKELILSSGYVIAKEPESVHQAFLDGSMQKSSGMMIKRERYLQEIPPEIIQKFEEYDLPLISMPFSVPYMDIMNQVNIAVMNRTIQRFSINCSGSYSLSNMTYKERKIKRILQAVEAEMHFPAMLYDLSEKAEYFSSANFRRIAENFGLSGQEFWSPIAPYTKHTLCDNIQMTRYRLIGQQSGEEGQVSWIVIPIAVNHTEQAYFIVMESRELLDYYDEYSIRIAYLMLQAMYEQIMVAQSVGNIGFENLVHYILDYGDQDPDKLIYQANMQGIAVSSRYVYIVFRQNDPEFSAREQRKQFMDLFAESGFQAGGRLVFLEENEGAIFIEAGQAKKIDTEKIRKNLTEFRRKVSEQYPEAELSFGMSAEPGMWLEMKANIDKCRRVMAMGRVLCPEEDIWDYDRLGPLTWLQIPEKELEQMLHSYKELLRDDKSAELLRTLKVYLESNLNYSLTAEKMFVHINTIRNRIDRVNQLLGIDWTNHVNRLKGEILLQFLDI